MLPPSPNNYDKHNLKNQKMVIVKYTKGYKVEESEKIKYK